MKYSHTNALEYARDKAYLIQMDFFREYTFEYVDILSGWIQDKYKCTELSARAIARREILLADHAIRSGRAGVRSFALTPEGLVSMDMERSQCRPVQGPTPWAWRRRA